MSDPADPLRTAVAEGAEVEVLGRIRWSSNATFLVQFAHGPDDQGSTRAIYKPARGEQPLVDFPAEIWRREVAAFELASALGWDCVPTTIPFDGPFGAGSLQRFVDADHLQHYFTMIDEDDPLLDRQLRRICCFDLIANNTDRKAGHCLLDAGRHVWAIDNALCFHADPKLRTVIWDFSGHPIDDELLGDVVGLVENGVPDAMTRWLDDREVQALTTRIRTTVHRGTFPVDDTGRRFPWPLI